MHSGSRYLFKISNSFQKQRKKQTKNEGKTGIFTLNQFLKKSILVFSVALK